MIRTQDTMNGNVGEAQSVMIMNTSMICVSGALGGGVRVVPCVRGAVALDVVMEVSQTNQFAEDMQGVQSHERPSNTYTVLGARGARRVGSRAQVAQAMAAPRSLVRRPLRPFWRPL
eukprot:COSAG01_NODE_9794_length_2341_cov_121.184211_4_plen_117_part_00